MEMGPNYASGEGDALARVDHHIICSLTGNRSVRGDTYMYLEKMCRPSHVDQLRTYVFQN